MKIAKYHVANSDNECQGLGPHKYLNGWLTFLYQLGSARGLEVLDKSGSWIPADPIAGTFVVDFGNAFEAITESAVRATIHRVQAPTQEDRYSIPFFMGLPVDLKVSKIRSFIPEAIRSMRTKENRQSSDEAAVSIFLDPWWDMLGESVIRKSIRSNPDIGLKWYGSETLEYHTRRGKS